MNETQNRFEELAADYFEFYYWAFPVAATFVGIHDHDERLGDYSTEVLSSTTAKLRHYAAELSLLDPRNLEPDAAADLKMLAARVRQEVREMDGLKTWRKNPANYPAVAAEGLHDLLVREFAPLEERLESMLGRLREVPEVLAAGRRNVAEPPKVFVETAMSMAAGLADLIQTVPPLAASDSLRRDLERAADKALEAVTEYARRLETLLPEAAGDFTVGREVFDAMLQDYNMLPYDADSLIAEGERLYRETEEQLAEVAREIDSGASIEEIDRRLKQDHPAAEELLEVYRREMARTREFVVEQGLARLPEGEDLRIEPTPAAFAPLVPGAMYMDPAPFEKQQTGIFFITTPGPGDTPEERESKLRNHAYSKLPITALHEGYPGHHLQLTRANGHPSPLRRQLASDLFIEGWAFYCEELMERLGYSDAPGFRFNRLKQQLWRAARIVIDGGLHTGRMTFEEAVALLIEAGAERGGAEAEVRRYCQTPTQPMSYLIGKLQIMEIHDRYREQSGDAFDLTEFHERLLSVGSLTPALAKGLVLS